MSSNYNVAVFGLGSMGYGMASSCIRSGFKTWGYDIAEEPVQRLIAEGGQTGSVAEYASTWNCVVVAVLNAMQLESVLFGEQGMTRHLKPGTVIIASATVAPEFARDMEARCLALNLMYLDAPMSGGSVKAASGDLSFMASGCDPAFDAAQPALDAMAMTVFRMGDHAGPGSAMKAVNQLLAGVHIATMGEALAFGIGQGIPAEQIVQVITQSAGNSWMFENRSPHVVSGDYTPHSAVDIWLKDLGIVLDIAKGARFSAPMTAAALQQFVAASGSGLGGEDDAAVTKIYARNAGIDLPGTEGSDQ